MLNISPLSFLRWKDPQSGITCTKKKIASFKIKKELVKNSYIEKSKG